MTTKKTNSKPRVLFIGDMSGETGLAAVVVRMQEEAIVIPSESLTCAVDTLGQHDFDLVCLAQPWPLIDVTDTEALVAAAAETPCVQLLGVWCEGEERTGRTVEGLTRIFWHAWRTWWSQWQENFKGTSGNKKRLTGETIVLATDGEMAGALREMLSDQGAGSVWIGRGGRVPQPSFVQNPTAAIWSGKQFSGREAESLRQLCQEMPSSKRGTAPVVALLDFPRAETVAAAMAVGAAVVLGKPVDDDLLCESLHTAIRSQETIPSIEKLSVRKAA